MLRHKNIDRVCCIVLVLTLLISCVFVGAAATGRITQNTAIGYETRLFDQSRVHTIDIVMDDWDAFLDTCTSEVYSSCHMVIDGESYKNVGIRGKGNTSLSSVAAYGNDRYSFKVEFDQYQNGMSYHGLDKLSLNNLIQDNTYMKDYFAYTLMNKMGVAAPLCSFVQINVNGEPWGLYLAVEGVEDAFLQRNYGKDYGELYKPDALSMGGGRGNGEDFNMDDFNRDNGEEMPAAPSGNDNGDSNGSSGGSAGGPAATDTPAPTQAPAADSAGFQGDAASNGDAASAGMPADATAPAMPTDGAMPAANDASNGDAASAGMPADATAPAMPTDGAMPAANDASNGDAASTGMPADATAPAEATDAPTGDASSGERADGGSSGRPAGDFQMPEGGFGGFGFGGSSDVKLQYNGDAPSNYSNIFNNAKTDITTADQTRLIASLKALSEGDVSVVDTDAVIRYMAVHNFLCNDDSYIGMMIHNYYLYEEDGVMAMIPWDYNLGYGGFSADNNGTSTINTSIRNLVSNGGTSDRPMAHWIASSEEYMAIYLEVYQEFITTVFDSGWFAAEIDRVTAMIDPYVKEDPTAFCTYEEFLTGSQMIKEFCLRRAQSVTNQLNGDNTRVDGSDLNLSLMGTMNNGGGGGFEAPGGDRNREQSADGTTTEGEAAVDGTTPAADAGRDDSFGGSSGGGAAPEASEKNPETPADGEESTQETERVRPEGGFNTSGMSRTGNNNARLVWLGIALAALLLGFLAAGLFRNHR